ncbi:MAG: flagellar biosynthesis protein FlhB [Nitratireductor sp.]
MSEDKDSKTEDPSQKKLQDTLDKGNVPFSKEITNVASLFAIIIVAYFMLPASANALMTLLRSMFANINDWPLEKGEEAANLIGIIETQLVIILMPLVLPLLAISLMSSFAQNQPRMVLNRIAPKLEKISLMKGLKRLFGKETAREFAKSLIKMGGAGFIAFSVMYYHSEYIASLIMVDPNELPGVVRSLFLKLIFGIAITMITLGVLDFIWVNKDWFDNLKMTKQEVKDETKQSEGDPMMKQKSRSIAQDRSRRRMISQVDTATMVIANPTHFSVAIRYVPGVDSIPVVVAKGQDIIALKIRGIAEANNIPVFEDKPLARGLYKVVQIDKDIPSEFFVPVAALIKGLMSAEKKAAQNVPSVSAMI